MNANVVVLDRTYQDLMTINQFSSEYFERFFELCDVKKKTIENYKTFLKNFAKWLQGDNIPEEDRIREGEPILNPTREDIKAYKEYLSKESFSIGTKQQYFQAVKVFFKWLSCEGMYKNITEGFKSFKVRTTETQKEAFTEEELQQILCSIDTTTPKGKRDKAMLLLAITGGLRIIEIMRADVGDIKERNRQKVLFIQGKGRDSKDEYIKIIPEVDEALQDYLSTRGDVKKNEPLFTGTSNNGKGTRITETSLSRLFKTIFKECGFNSDRLTAHSLRHSSNTLLFKSCSDIYKVQKHARHSQIQTTERYIHSFEREKDTSEQEIFNQLFNKKNSKIDDIKSRLNELSKEEIQEIKIYINQL